MRFSGNIDGGFCWEELTRRRFEDEKCLERYGYKVYSQNDEDGIIQEIFSRIGTTDKRFIEFGVQNGLESNCHYLLFKGWTGINELFTSENFTGDIDLLSIDIDGNDYYVWKAINVIRPRVIVIEYNGKFPPDLDWKQAYNSKHIWDGSDWHGASLKAYELLGRELGYQLVGTNLTGSNAFFVRQDLAGDKFITPATAENLYNPLRKYMRIYHPGHNARYCVAVHAGRTWPEKLYFER